MRDIRMVIAALLLPGTLCASAAVAVWLLRRP